jgi:exopolysaccharide biosynthesis protein
MKRYPLNSIRKLFTKYLIVAATLAVPAILMSSNTVQAEHVKEKALNLGHPKLMETREKTEIAPGLIHTKITRGTTSEKDVFIIDIGYYQTEDEAVKVKNQLKELGYESQVKDITERPSGDTEKGPLGYLVHVGSFQSESEANKLRDELNAKGFTKSRVVFSAENGEKTTGPWVINVLKIDPKKFKGQVLPELGTEIVPKKEKLTSISTRKGALASINGGYFVVGSSDGTEGDLAGVSMINGHLISEAVNGRTTLILDRENAQIDSVETHLTVTSSDGAERALDGLNRKPGLIRGCGGVGDTFDYPKHDFTCTDSGELVQFTPAFGMTTESGDGIEVVLNSSGLVIEVRKSRGGLIPENGSVLAGTGDAAEWLLAHGKVGEKINVETSILAGEQPFKVSPTTGMINGGPSLLHDGEETITAISEGFHWKDNPEFYYRFGERRHPRTLAGVTKNDEILLVTVDGRQPGHSVGANFEESARIMKSLGAVDAVNLDGGGSTTMAVGSEMVTRPSDRNGERPIGDAIVILP